MLKGDFKTNIYVEDPETGAMIGVPIGPGHPPMTYQQGERIIELLEELVSRTQPPQPLPLPYLERTASQESMDKEIAENLKRRNVSDNI